MRAADQAHSTYTATLEGDESVAARTVVTIVAVLALLAVWRPALVHAQGTGSAAAPSLATQTAGKESVELPSVSAARKTSRAAERMATVATQPSQSREPSQPPTKASAPTATPTKASAPTASPTKASSPAAAAPKTAVSKTPERKPSAPADAAAQSPALAAAPASTPAVVPNRLMPEPVAPSASRIVESPIDTDPPAPVDLQRQKQTVMTRDGAVRIGLVTSTEQAASRQTNEIRTVFHRDLPDAAEAERRTRAAMRPNAPVPRQGEFDAAPFVLSARELAAAGVITARVGSVAGADESYPDKAMRSDRVALRGSPSQRFEVGQRWQSVAPGQSVGKDKHIVAQPSGLLEVESIADGGLTAVAVVREQSARIESGQRLVAAGGAPAPRVVTERLAAPDIATSVLWLDPAQALPTLQSFLLIGAGSSRGVKAGDEFAVYQHLKGGRESMSATARIVRVGPEHSAAVIIRQFSAEIGVGMTARRVGRAP